MPNKKSAPGTKGRHVSGTERERFAVQVASAYNGGATIREIAAQHSRSYGMIHRLLVEGGVRLRGRGGSGQGRLVK